MSAPRITLWTDPFKMPLRLSICAFTDRIDRQVADIQSSAQRTIEITPGALYILSCVAGRRITEPVRWALFDSLRDILNGKLRTLHPERQDLLASTFGELLGAALLSLQLEGSVEIIRLLESQQGKMPDFLLLQSTPTDHRMHILECKGRVEDVNNINAHVLRQTVYDLCHEQQGFRADAKKQIDCMEVSDIRSGPRTMIRQKLSFGISQQASTKNVIVSSVPDGRILWLCDTEVAFAPRPQCSPRDITCNKCMNNRASPLPDNSSQANVISVLYQEEIESGSPIDLVLSSFLTRYRTVSRAAWSGNDLFFGTSFGSFIDQLSDVDEQNMLPVAIFMVVTLIETAIFDELVHFDIGNSGQHLFTTALRVPEILQAVLLQTYNKFLDMRPLSRKQVEEVGGDQRREGQDRITNKPNKENSRWYDLDPSIDRITQFAEENEEITLLVSAKIPEWNDTIYGSAHYEEPFTLVIRLASATKNPSALKEYLEALIARLRPTDSPEYRKRDWKDEYFAQDGQNPFIVGASWDMFPYANTNNGKPGITAWWAEDGRAEVIVRTLER